MAFDIKTKYLLDLTRYLVTEKYSLEYLQLLLNDTVLSYSTFHILLNLVYSYLNPSNKERERGKTWSLFSNYKT